MDVSVLGGYDAGGTAIPVAYSPGRLEPSAAGLATNADAFPGTVDWSGVPAFDPLTIGAAVLVLLACAGAALMAPVRRATQADPIAVLR